MSGENVSLPVAQALASALEKIEAYVPTEYVDNSEPDIDAEHLNHAEQGIMRVTNLLNAAVDVIQGQESRLSDAETKVGTAALTGGMTDLSSGVNSLYSNLADTAKLSVGNVFTEPKQQIISSQMSADSILPGLNIVARTDQNQYSRPSIRFDCFGRGGVVLFFDIDGLLKIRKDDGTTKTIQVS